MRGFWDVCDVFANHGMVLWLSHETRGESLLGNDGECVYHFEGTEGSTRFHGEIRVLGRAADNLEFWEEELGEMLRSGIGYSVLSDPRASILDSPDYGNIESSFFAIHKELETICEQERAA